MTPRGPPAVRYSRRRRVLLIMPGFLNCAYIARYYFAKSMFSEVIKRCKKTRQAPKIQAPRVFRAFIMPAYCVIYRYNSIDPALASCQVSQEAGQVVWYAHLFQNFPQFIVIHTVTDYHNLFNEPL